MGVVFKARDTRLNRDVALKIIHPASSNTQLQAAFLREARLASSLNHPGIVTIYDILFIGGLTCIVMEFVSGSPLHHLIPQGVSPSTVRSPLAARSEAPSPQRTRQALSIATLSRQMSW